MAERVRNNNAYLLFYERVGKPEKEEDTSILGGLDSSIVTSTLAPSTSGMEATVEGQDDDESGDDDDYRAENGDGSMNTPGRSRSRRTASLNAFFDTSSLVGAHNPRNKRLKGMEQPLPANVRRAVWEENMTFFRDKHLFDRGR